MATIRIDLRSKRLSDAYDRLEKVEKIIHQIERRVPQLQALTDNAVGELQEAAKVIWSIAVELDKGVTLLE